MKLVKTYDNVGNISEKTYIEDAQGNLTETSLKVGVELPAQPNGLNRIYFELLLEA